MPGKYFIEHWLIRHAHLNDLSLIDSQLSQAYARIVFASAGLLYMILHAADFTPYKIPFLIAGSLYYLVNLISIPLIRKQPLSAVRTLLFPIFDVGIVSFSMLVDGGQSSGLFFIFLLIILGNGLRFGNTLLIYTQCLCLVGLAALLLYSRIYLQMDIEYSLLFWQTVSLLAIPFYVYLIGRRVEDAFRGKLEAEKSAHSLINKGPLPIFTFELDKHGAPRILFANGAVNETFQLNHSKLMNERADTLILPEDSEEMMQFCRAVLVAPAEGEEPLPVHNLYIRSRPVNEHILKLQCTAIRMRWKDRHVGVCFMLDISARENIQEELQAIHKQGYLTAMVAGIVHDFRNVLTNMIGYAEVLQMTTKDEAAKQPLEAIIAAGDRGSELIAHLLKLSKNDNDDLLPAFCAGDQILGPLEHILGLARLQMPPHIKLETDIESPLHDVPISVIEIEQIIMNLINNSAQAMSDKGEICVHISLDTAGQLAVEEHPSLCIQVTDNGPGISPENLDQIFKPFWTSRAGSGGTGLGLTMVQRIVKRNGGTIKVASEANKQTTFTIHLPPYISDSEESIVSTESAPSEDQVASDPQPIDPPAPATEHRPRPIQGQNGCHILLVDDVPDILKIHQSILARLSHTTVTAENGRQALNLFKQAEASADEPRFDLIITDFRMPVMDGGELVDQIRNSGSDVPILMITAFGEDQQLQRTTEQGVMVINKPVSMETFSQAISAAMRSAPK